MILINIKHYTLQDETSITRNLSQESSTWSNDRSAASCVNIPATKASPAPVVSTASTFKPLALPLNSCENINMPDNFRIKILIQYNQLFKTFDHTIQQISSKIITMLDHQMYTKLKHISEETQSRIQNYQFNNYMTCISRHWLHHREVLSL